MACSVLEGSMRAGSRMQFVKWLHQICSGNSMSKLAVIETGERLFGSSFKKEPVFFIGIVKSSFLKQDENCHNLRILRRDG